MKAKLTVLGSGTSMGVPTIGCTCAVCHSPDARDRRTRPVLAGPLPNLFMTQFQVAAKAFQGLCDFNGIQVFALYILNQGNLCDGAVVNVHLNTGHFPDPRFPSSPPTPLACDDHPATA